MADWKEVVKLSPEERMKIKYDDPRLDSFANEVEKKYNLPPGLIVSVKNAGERSNTGQVSSAGAKGVMQFIDSTRKLYPHDPDNPLASIDAAGRYFKDLLKNTKGNIKEALMDYNWGRGNRMKQGAENMPEETRKYIENIFGYAKKNFKTPIEDKPTAVKATVPVEIDWKVASPEQIRNSVNYIPKKGEQRPTINWKDVSDETLLNLDQVTLLHARDEVQPSGDQELIDRMAHYDYIAFARETVRNNPINAAAMPVNSLAWTIAKYGESAAKKLGLVNETSRSSASFSQTAAGIQGTIMGLKDLFLEKPKEE